MAHRDVAASSSFTSGSHSSGLELWITYQNASSQEMKWYVVSNLKGINYDKS